MNKNEQLVYDWLVGTGKVGLVFQQRDSPDFIDANGEGYEAKLLRQNTITFSVGQLDKLLKFRRCSILVMLNGGKSPIAVIPILELVNKPGYWKQYRIRSFDNVPSVYKCTDCGVGFDVTLSSRRVLCDDCLVEHILNKKNKKNSSK